MFKKLWRGELPLWLTFWIFGVVGFTLWQGFFYFIGRNFENSTRISASLYVVTAVELIYSIFIGVAVWRSATNYKGSRFLANAARIIIILGILNVVTDIYFLYEYESNIPGFQQKLEEEIKAKNKKLPIKWGEELEWYKVALEGDNMVFYYRFVGLNAGQKEFIKNNQAIIDKKLDNLFSGEGVCNSKDAKLFFQHNLGLLYRVEIDGQTLYIPIQLEGTGFIV